MLRDCPCGQTWRAWSPRPWQRRQLRQGWQHHPLSRKKWPFPSPNWCVPPDCASWPRPGQSGTRHLSMVGKGGAEEEGFGGEKQPKVFWARAAASSVPVMLAAALGGRTTGDLSQPGKPHRHKLRCRGWEADNSGGEVQRRAGPREQIPAWGSRRGLPASPMPLPAPFYPRHSPETEMMVLAFLLLLGERC